MINLESGVRTSSLSYKKNMFAASTLLLSPC